MRIRDIIGLVLALILAVGVALLTRVFLTKSAPESQQKIETVKQATKVLVAARTLLSGETIKLGDLAWQDWEKDAVVSNYLTDSTNKIEDFTNAVVRFPIHKGNPIVREELVKKGEKGFLAALVDPGKRAISIDITASSADSGLIFPGDYVDVLVSLAVSVKDQQLGKSKTILKNIKVLAIDTTLSTLDVIPKITPRVATLEVTPAQAEVLMAGTKEGTITLSLHGIEKEPVESTPQMKPIQKKAQDKKIILMRGQEKSEIEFQEQ